MRVSAERSVALAKVDWDAGTEVLIGNTFPVTLVRGWRVALEEVPAGALREVLGRAGARVHSFWGHEETRRAAEGWLGLAEGALAPRVARPAVRLDAAGRPTLDGVSFGTCWVLSPDVAGGGRPAPGTAAQPAAIVGWHLLRLRWEAPVTEGLA